jgi:hypothetical protein
VNKAQEQYTSPAVGSVAPLMSKQKDITGALLNSISPMLEKRGLLKGNMLLPIHERALVVHMKDYLNRHPKRAHKRYWIDTEQGLAVIHPETHIPLFFNTTGSTICSLCDGEHSIKEMLDTLQKKWSIPSKVLETDFMKFIILVEELDLVEL